MDQGQGNKGSTLINDDEIADLQFEMVYMCVRQDLSGPAEVLTLSYSKIRALAPTIILPMGIRNKFFLFTRD